MKKIPPVLSPSSSSNPAFWVPASPGRAKVRGGSAERRLGFAGAFAAEIGRSNERSRQFPAIRHYVIYDEPDLAGT